ncbi:hypothetical protein [Rhodospirillum sp. A1_3_36]
MRFVVYERAGASMASSLIKPAVLLLGSAMGMALLSALGSTTL